MGDMGFTRRRQKVDRDVVFDYKDVSFLQQFLSQGGKITSVRTNRLTAKQQRSMVRAVKRARQIALLPNGTY